MKTLTEPKTPPPAEAGTGFAGISKDYFAAATR